MKDLVVPAPMRIIHSANTALTFCSPTSSFGRKKEKSVTRRVHSIPNNRVDKITDFIHAESSRAVSVVHCKLASAALNTTWYIRGLTGDVSAESELSFELDIAYSRVWKCYSFWSPRCTCDKKKIKKNGVMKLGEFVICSSMLRATRISRDRNGVVRLQMHKFRSFW